MVIEHERDTAQHAAWLPDSKLDRLIDLHIAKKLPHCTGYCEFCGIYSGIYTYECMVCGGPEQRTLDQRLFGSSGHARRIPHYTADRVSARAIFDALRRNFKATVLVCFIENLHAMCPSWYSFEMWLLFDATAQQIALAALMAVGVVDQQGYLIVEEKAS